MARKEPVPDSAITQKATQQISNRGLRTPCRISVQTRKGEVTLSGHVLYPHQRDAAIAAIRSIDGIRKVHDQIKVRPPVKHEYKTLPPKAKEVVAPEAETAAEKETASESAENSQAPVAGAETPTVAETASTTTEFELGPAPVRRGPAAPPAISPAPPASPH
jgi:BON domain-containing protein